MMETDSEFSSSTSDLETESLLDTRENALVRKETIKLLKLDVSNYTHRYSPKHEKSNELLPVIEETRW